MAHSAFPALAEGVYAALATPCREDSIEPDTAALLDYVDIVARAGVDGLVLFGTTGEFVHYDVAERIRTFGLAIRRSRVPVLVNVSHSTLDGALILAESAMGSGAAGILVMPPYFYRYSDGEILRFYLQFIELIEQRIPTYLDNAPAFTNPISESLAQRLLDTGLFAGIKDSSGDWELFQKLNEMRHRHDFRLLSGNEEYTRGREHQERAALFPAWRRRYLNSSSRLTTQYAKSGKSAWDFLTRNYRNFSTGAPGSRQRSASSRPPCCGGGTKITLQCRSMMRIWRISTDSRLGFASGFRAC